jgi:hypothetical protein
VARHGEPPPYRGHLLDRRVPAIESVCGDEMRSEAGVAKAAAQAHATPTCTTDMRAVCGRQAL